MGNQLPICYLFKTFWHWKIDDECGGGEYQKAESKNWVTVLNKMYYEEKKIKQDKYM